MKKSMRKRSSSKRHNVSVCVNAGDTGEACKTRGRLTAKMRDPFGSGTIQSEVPHASERVTFASVWISGWYIYLFHTCTHSQFRDAQFVVSVCVYVSKFEVKHASTSAGIDRKVTTHEKTAPTVSGVTLYVDFSRREKSLMDFQEQENHIFK